MKTGRSVKVSSESENNKELQSLRGFRITSSSTVKLLDAKKRSSSSLISVVSDTGRTQVLLFQLTLMGVRFHPSISQTDR